MERDLPGLTEPVLGAFGTVLDAAAAWILDYWVRHTGREPGPDEIEPATRGWMERGRAVSGSAYLLAMGDLQAFSRTVARFLTEVDVWLTPTLGTLPVSLGAITGSGEDPAGTVDRFLAFPCFVANITGAPAMSVPLHWNEDGLPVGAHFLGRFGDEATLLRLASQLEAAEPWAWWRPAV